MKVLWSLVLSLVLLVLVCACKSIDERPDDPDEAKRWEVVYPKYEKNGLRKGGGRSYMLPEMETEVIFTYQPLDTDEWHDYRFPDIEPEQLRSILENVVPGNPEEGSIESGLTHVMDFAVTKYSEHRVDFRNGTYNFILIRHKDSREYYAYSARADEKEGVSLWVYRSAEFAAEQQKALVMAVLMKTEPPKFENFITGRVYDRNGNQVSGLNSGTFSMTW